MPPVHRPPGAASIFLILRRSVTRSRQRAVPVIGYRSGGSAGALLPPRSARGLRETGYAEGQIVTIEYRWAEGRTPIAAEHQSVAAY